MFAFSRLCALFLMLLTALDFGSSQLKIIVAELKRDGRFLVLKVFKKPSLGIRKGEIAVLDEATHSLHQALHEVKRFNRAALKHIFINVNGNSVHLQGSRGIVAVSRPDNEILDEDVQRVIKASQAISVSPNRMILHTITKEFIVDGVRDIRDPLGMIGNRLEVNSLIVDAFRPSVNNLMKCVELATGRIGGLVYGPLASARAVLSKNQKDLGVLMLDIGFGTTSLAVYEEDRLLHANVIPIGSGHITNDLAIGLRCPVKVAERIKLSFGSALAKDVSNKDKIDLRQIDDQLRSVVSRRFIAEIIEVRLAEIFDFVNNELKLIGKLGQLPAGVVLTGGGSRTHGLLELVKQELKLPVQLGIAELKDAEFSNVELEEKIDASDFSVAVGLLMLAHEQLLKERGWFAPSRKFSSILRYLLP